MKHLIIIGARGWGREVYGLAKDCVGYFEEYDIKGFLDDKADALDGMDGYPPIIGAVETYEPQKDDVFVCALGDSGWRKHIEYDKIQEAREQGIVMEQYMDSVSDDEKV